MISISLFSFRLLHLWRQIKEMNIQHSYVGNFIILTVIGQFYHRLLKQTLEFLISLAPKIRVALKTLIDIKSDHPQISIASLEVPVSSSSGISFQVPLGGPNSNAMSCITCCLFSPCNGVRKTSRTGDHGWFRCYSSDLVKGIDIASTLEPVDTS